MSAAAAPSGPRILLRRLREVMAGEGKAQQRMNQLVTVIAATMVAEVCSIYLLRTGVLELFATEGLNSSAVHKTNLRIGEGLVGQIAQLNMVFGSTQYWPAEPLLRDQVPKLVLTIGRAAAVWSLGYFYEDQSDQTLASAFLGRLQDYRGLYPECTEVRRQAAIALGRMGAKVHLGTLQEFYENGRHDIDIGGATRWAVMRLTGVTLAPIGPQYEPDRHWFLQPLDDVSEDEYLRQIN